MNQEKNTAHHHVIVVVKSSDASCTKGATFKIKTLVQLFTDLNWS